MKIVTLWYDPDGECPNEGRGWRLHSFSRKHSNYKDPDRLFPPDIGLRRRLACGIAFVLSYYEHSACAWSLQGEGPQCPWDSVGVAGILVWDPPARELPKGRAARKASARAFCEEYTAWANGWCCGYTVEDEDGEVLDSCGGFLCDEEYMASRVREVVRGDYVEFKGDAAWLKDHHDFVGESAHRAA